MFKGPYPGYVNFTDTENGHVDVSIDIRGLPDGEHGIHVHSGDSDECSDLDGHFSIFPIWTESNSDGIPHGSYKDNTVRHTGDLCNNVMSIDGVAKYQYTDHLISLTLGDPANIVGMSVVIHSDRDDEGKGGDVQSKITGNSGKRLACSRIEYL